MTGSVGAAQLSSRYISDSRRRRKAGRLLWRPDDVDLVQHSSGFPINPF